MTVVYHVYRTWTLLSNFKKTQGFITFKFQKDTRFCSVQQHQVLTLLDVVVRQGTTILQLFPSEDQPLLIRRNAWQNNRSIQNTCHVAGYFIQMYIIFVWIKSKMSEMIAGCELCSWASNFQYQLAFPASNLFLPTLSNTVHY